ncbi:MAG: oligosaccharide flippase family protein [Alphaproteobacteria bacterium]|nr:oligosaccharide flippase family protein [Alphaproteobacteria bacterium]
MTVDSMASVTHKIRTVIRKILLGEAVFLRRVLILMSGSVLAQALPIAAAPILSRLFAPEHIGILGLYTAAISIGGTLSTLRYETAVLLPEEDMDAAAIVVLSIGTSFVFGLIFTIIFLLDGNILHLIGLEHMESLWGWIPPGIVLISVFQVLSIWTVRSLRFSGLAFSRISQSASTAIAQVAAGFFKAGAFGLLAGQVLGQIIGVFVMAKNLWLKDRVKFVSLNTANIKKVAIIYRRFPLLSLPAGLSNVLANYIPLFLIGSYFGPAAVGFYALTQRVLAAPVALIGNAVLDVFKERAASDYRIHGSCRKLYRKIFLALSILSVPPSLLLFLFAPPLFAWVFGETWREAGEYARLLSPLLLIRFVASPLSYVFFIAQRQNIDLVWQLCLLFVGIITIAAGRGHVTPHLSIGFFSAGFSLMYIIYIILSYYYAKSPTSKEEAL